jgi:hypothetical protein
MSSPSPRKRSRMMSDEAKSAVQERANVRRDKLDAIFASWQAVWVQETQAMLNHLARNGFELEARKPLLSNGRPRVNGIEGLWITNVWPSTNRLDRDVRIPYLGAIGERSQVQCESKTHAMELVRANDDSVKAYFSNKYKVRLSKTMAVLIDAKKPKKVAEREEMHVDVVSESPDGDEINVKYSIDKLLCGKINASGVGLYVGHPANVVVEGFGDVNVEDGMGLLIKQGLVLAKGDSVELLMSYGPETPGIVGKWCDEEGYKGVEVRACKNPKQGYMVVATKSIAPASPSPVVASVAASESSRWFFPMSPLEELRPYSVELYTPADDVLVDSRQYKYGFGILAVAQEDAHEFSEAKPWDDTLKNAKQWNGTTIGSSITIVTSQCRDLTVSVETTEIAGARAVYAVAHGDGETNDLVPISSDALPSDDEWGLYTCIPYIVMNPGAIARIDTQPDCNALAFEGAAVVNPNIRVGRELPVAAFTGRFFTHNQVENRLGNGLTSSDAVMRVAPDTYVDGNAGGRNGLGMFMRRVPAEEANVFATLSDNSVAIVVGAKEIEEGEELLLAEYDPAEVIDCVDELSFSQIPEDYQEAMQSTTEDDDDEDDVGGDDGIPTKPILTASQIGTVTSGRTKVRTKAVQSAMLAMSSSSEDDEADDDGESASIEQTRSKRRRAPRRGGTKEEWDAWALRIVRDMTRTNCYAVDLNDSKYSSVPDKDVEGHRTRRNVFGGRKLSPMFWDAMKGVFSMVQVLRLPVGKTLGRADVEALCKGAKAGPLWGVNMGECQVEKRAVLETFATLMPGTKIGWLYLDDAVRYLIKGAAVRDNIADALGENRKKTKEPMPSNPTTDSALARKHGKWISHNVAMSMNPIVEDGEPNQPRLAAAVDDDDDDDDDDTGSPSEFAAAAKSAHDWANLSESDEDGAVLMSSSPAAVENADASDSEDSDVQFVQVVQPVPNDTEGNGPDDDDEGGAQRSGGGAAERQVAPDQAVQGISDPNNLFIDATHIGENTTVLGKDAGDGLMISTRLCSQFPHRLKPVKKKDHRFKLLLYNKGPDYNVYVQRPRILRPGHKDGTTMYTTPTDVTLKAYSAGDRMSVDYRLSKLTNLGFACMARLGKRVAYLVPNCFVLCNDPKDAEWEEDRRQAYIQVCTFSEERVAELCKRWTPVRIKHPRLKRMMAVDALLMQKYMGKKYTGEPRQFPMSSIDLCTEATDQMIYAKEMMLADRPMWYLTNSSAAGPDCKGEGREIADAMQSPTQPEVKIGLAFWYDPSLVEDASDPQKGCPAYYGIVANKRVVVGKAKALMKEGISDMQGLWLYQYTLPAEDDDQAESRW